VKNCIIAGFHYSYRDGELQTDHSNMLRSILYEILFQEESFFFHFQTHYRNGLQPGTPYRWSYDSLKKIVESFRDHPAEKRLYFIIDAMDESDETDRRDILSLLRRLCSTKTLLKVKIFLASRPIAGLDHRTTGTRVIKLQEENERDIFNFAQSFLGPELELPSDVISQAREYIVSHAQGVFIWVYLVKEELVKYSDRGCSQEDIFEFLKSLPTELEGFYKRILYKLKEGNKRDVMDGFRMFYFVLFAYRPLRVEELQHALCIPDIPDATFLPSDASFNTKLIYGINKRIIHCGGNLLETKGLSGTVLSVTFLFTFFC
jgi:hypothetical protein